MVKSVTGILVREGLLHCFGSRSVKLKMTRENLRDGSVSKVLLCKHEELSLDLQHLHIKLSTEVCICKPSPKEAEMEESWDSLVDQPSQMGEFQVQ